ncbi:phosphate ABC transporter membrane protein 1 (PhoT family) [Breoghania corrubedonensis]|uniref:Phosphate transport system permease protein n=1 Tax=Breoghania corrubedonensis TaxID=665038 RepID=A0A2T5VEH0_9HYPH|nr:phosphate ABC transporter permease subunit PstC [Breoghania corrubedonensis]PTW62151.1 phosphate ABC transporter membrane protein 1 (PhoT family) [Breoghania corrubedonensis]
MSTTTILSIVLVLAVVAYVLGRTTAKRRAAASGTRLHSREGYYGSFALLWTIIPSLVLLAVWLLVSPAVIDTAVRDSFPEHVKAETQATQGLAMGMVDSIARGLRRLDEQEMTRVTAGFSALRPVLASKGVALAGDGEDYMIDAAIQLNGWSDASRLWMTICVIGLALAGLLYAVWRIRPEVRARNSVERAVLVALIGASAIAILTTIGIVLSMLSETISFFRSVPAMEFFFGTVWDPRFAATVGTTSSDGQFGLIPLLAGTVYIAFVAMLFAVPIGLFAATYLAEYAGPKFRAFAKPLIEVLAGIPTIVYGFFALVTVGPFLRDLSADISGIVTGNATSFIQAQSVLTAGLVMGIMLIPFVSSLSDDIITAVPRAMRDGSLGLGATRSETMRKVILPAALPGIVGALLLTASRAIGETMIVVLAAGVAARLTINPFEPMTTVTVKIVNQLTGDLEFNSPQTLVAFALGLTLFFITLGLNIYALYIVRKYREQYE